MHQFYSPNYQGEDTFLLSPEESKHAIKVLRLKTGNKILLTNGLGLQAEGIIFNDRLPEIEFKKEASVSVQPTNKLNLFVGLLEDHGRMEWLVEKLTELGLSKIIIVKTARSGFGKLKLERLNQTAISALKQSKGATLPQIYYFENLKASLELVDKESLNLLAHLETNTIPLNQVNCIGKDINFFIGPEGDFTLQEINLLQENGLISVSLGNNVLRAETAAISVAAYLKLL